MAIEKSFDAVSQPFTANGTAQGIITVADASGFYAKQKVTLTSNTQPALQLEVRRVTPTTIQVGHPGTPFNGPYADVSAYTVADSATATAPEQVKPVLKPDEIIQAVYARDPAVALRTLQVNKFGQAIDTVTGIDGKTRLAVDASVSVSGLSVDLDALLPGSQANPDNVLTAGSEDGTRNGPKLAFVNNRRLQILAGQDRTANITYADFGTKDQRVTQIDYTAPSIGSGPGYTARLTLSYTLVGNRYRRDSLTWSII